MTMTQVLQEFDQVRFVRHVGTADDMFPSGMRAHAFKGETGVIMHIHRRPHLAYVVEVRDEKNYHTLALVDALPDDVEAI